MSSHLTLKTIQQRLYILGGFVLLIAITGVAPAAKAAQGSISISSQPSFYYCSLTDATPGIRTVYVLHTFNAGSTASRFRITKDAGVTMTYMSETHPLGMAVGNTQSGISICYGTCLTDNQLLATIQYMSYGTSALCSKLLVVPHPAAQTVEALDCNFSPVVTFVDDLTMQTATGSCGCAFPHTFPGVPQAFDCTPVAVKSTSWGAIKALYQD